MKLPDFLIIGAMKAGTTSLYRDLLTNPDVFMPARKEPNSLCDDRVRTPEGREEYAALFAPAREGQVCGEASTAYTKLPDFPGVPMRARRVLSEGARFIYLVREPVSRAVSHHRHAATFAGITEGIDEAVRAHPMLINYSLYAMQARPWLEEFGPQRVRIVQFEAYVKDRRAGVAALCEFLGITPRPELVETDKVFNKADAKPVPKGPFALIQRRGFYKQVVRPLIPAAARDLLRARLLPKAAPAPPGPSMETVDSIIDRVRDDAEELRRMMGLERPLWDFEAVRRRYASGEAEPRGAPEAA